MRYVIYYRIPFFDIQIFHHSGLEFKGYKIENDLGGCVNSSNSDHVIIIDKLTVIMRDQLHFLVK